MTVFHETNDCFSLQRRDVLRLLGASSLGAAALPLFAQDAKLPKLVTVSGAITEVVYLLGAEAQLVGTDTTSLYPAAARATPKVGYMRQLSAEGLLSLKPDAIIATNESGPAVVLDQVRSAGVKVEIIDADHSWGEVQRKVQAVGRAAAREAQARELQAKLDAEWGQVQQRVAAASKGRKPRVLFVLSHSASPQVSGEKTAAHSVIGLAGGVNALGGFQGYRPMTAEAMASAAPDIILTSTQSIEAHGGVDKFWQRPELALTPAFKKQKRSLITQDALLLLGFGPRMPAAIAELHEKFLAATA
jgi:iron complex transport system substrate-binding protein